MKCVVRLATSCLLTCLLFGQAKSTPTSRAPNPAATYQAIAERLPDASNYELLNNVKGLENSRYTDQVLGAVQQKWYALTARAERAPDGNPGETTIEASIKRDGSIGKITMVESSGETTLDNFALEGVKSAGPFPPLPTTYASEMLELRFHFEYNRPASEDRPACTGNFRKGVYRVGGDVKAPRAVDQADPAYSEDARKTKRQGTVILRLTVGIDGVPSDICIARAAGNGLDEMAIGAVKSWKFEAATKDGVPVPVRIMVETSFRLY